VTEFISDAIQQMHFDKITLVLKVAPQGSRDQNNYALFHSIDPDLPEYRPQLVFSYKPLTTNPFDTTVKIAAGLPVVAGAAIVIYIFWRRKRKSKYYRKPRFQQKNVKRS